ncbi:phosphotransferase enzyme family protein [Sphingomonas sp. MMS24-J13]|uniref:phosphotransferase enzyme family protein n=1 Tax=Sphingomonas sp. MMS24-J13 TaxID=3238686 RepID=UPI00384B74CC
MDNGLIAVKAAHALLDPTDLARAIAGRFAVPPIERAMLHRSFINDTYRAEAGGRRFYLRVYQAGWRDERAAAAEMAIIEALAAAGAAVARPVARRDGGGFVIAIRCGDLVRPAVLFEDAPGDDLNFSDVDGAANAARYGRAAAALHNAADGMTRHPDRPILDRLAMIEVPHAVIARAVEAKDRMLLDRLVDGLLARIDPGLSQGFAHGDLNSSNIHFTDGGATVIDFDCCGWGWRANDIAAFARGVTLARMPGAEASALIRAYLAGYEAVRSIAPVDRAALPVFLLVQRLWMASLHLDGRDHRWGTASFGKPYVARLMAWLAAWECVLDDRPDWL